MKCLCCGKWGNLICKACMPDLALGTRLVDEMSVYSFYSYSDLEFLIGYKYEVIGSRVFALLSKKAYSHFAQNVSLPQGVFGVGIDDCVDKGYSHTGVFLHSFARCGIKPLYGALRAHNHISYAGKSLQYRQDNPKGFQSSLWGKTLVLFDDIITTGTTLREAKKLLQSQENTILFSLVLCDAGR